MNCSSKPSTSLEESLVGQSWDVWLCQISLPPGKFEDDWKSTDCAHQTSSVSALPHSKAICYGECPAQDEFLLVHCPDCDLLLKPMAFSHHHTSRHQKGESGMDELGTDASPLDTALDQLHEQDSFLLSPIFHGSGVFSPTTRQPFPPAPSETPDPPSVSSIKLDEGKFNHIKPSNKNSILRRAVALGRRKDKSKKSVASKGQESVEKREEPGTDSYVVRQSQSGGLTLRISKQNNEDAQTPIRGKANRNRRKQNLTISPMSEEDGNLLVTAAHPPSKMVRSQFPAVFQKRPCQRPSTGPVETPAGAETGSASELRTAADVPMWGVSPCHPAGLSRESPGRMLDGGGSAANCIVYNRRLDRLRLGVQLALRPRSPDSQSPFSSFAPREQSEETSLRTLLNQTSKDHPPVRAAPVPHSTSQFSVPPPRCVNVSKVSMQKRGRTMPVKLSELIAPATPKEIPLERGSEPSELCSIPGIVKWRAEESESPERKRRRPGVPSPTSAILVSDAAHKTPTQRTLVTLPTGQTALLLDASATKFYTIGSHSSLSNGATALLVPNKPGLVLSSGNKQAGPKPPGAAQVVLMDAGSVGRGAVEGERLRESSLPRLPTTHLSPVLQPRFLLSRRHHSPV